MIWGSLAITGACLIVVGISADYVDDATHFRYGFLSDRFNLFLIGLIAGVVSAFAGTIGWAKSQNPSTRARTAGMVFVFPWILIAAGHQIEGLNVHGPSMLAVLLVVPASILALALWIMAGF